MRARVLISASGVVAAASLLLVTFGSPLAGASDAPRSRHATGLIQHVVVIFQENHSFDEFLGGLCVRDNRCDGASSGKVSTGEVIPLHAAPDIAPPILHSSKAQTTAVDGGLMDHFDLLPGCSKDTGYACYEQYTPQQIPNLAALARAFVISDRTFEGGRSSSWGAHFVLAAADLDGFVGDNPKPGAMPPGPGWGCDSFKDAAWTPPGGGRTIKVPSCVPKPDGSGPYRPSPVKWVPTIMDRMDAAGRSWQIDVPSHNTWAICPYFAECIYGPQATHVKPSDQVLEDAAAGKLPNLSLVMPCCGNSQHPGVASVLKGDNWIAQVVSAIVNGPQWGTTAIFITYDDCGCFYDHVPPPPDLGIRVPMVIVSPYARPGFTDSNSASFQSMLAFTEHIFGLPPLAASDATAYDYNASFDFSQKPLAPIRLSPHKVPAGELRWLKAHPPDPNDPT
jgi:phospholipase C